MNRRKFLSATAALGAVTISQTACSSLATESSDTSTMGGDDIMPLEERRRWLKSFACNIEQWFRPMPFLDRILAAKELGFSAVEMWNPMAPGRGKTPETIAERIKEHGMLLTSYSPQNVSLADPSNEVKAMEWLDKVIKAGKILQVPNFNVTGHKLVEGLSVDQMVENYIKTLRKFVPILEAEGAVATIEPLNPFNHKGNFIYGHEPALTICREVDSPNVKLNWDFFHMQRINGNLITNLENGFDQVAYIQFADSPGRNQPGTGEVAYGNVFTKLRELGYHGYIGSEFFPKDKNPLKAASDLAKLAKSINLTDPTVTFRSFS